MPRLPSKYDLNQATPQPSRQIIGGIQPVEQEAAANLGNSVARLGLTGMALRQEKMDQEDRLNDAKARSLFLQTKVQADSAFEEDPDYKTFEPRYGEMVTKAQKAAASLIRDPVRREAFMADTNLDRIQGIASIKKKAFAKEGDFERGALDGIIASNREASLRAPDEKTRAALIQNTQDRIQGLIDVGHIDADQGKALQRKSAEDYATASIDILSPAQQVQKLKPGVKGIVDLIPSDKRADMLRRAEQQLKQEQALNRAAISDRVQDATAAYLSGLKYDNPPTQQEMVSAYGEKEGQQRYASLQKTQKLGADISYAALATPEELASMLASRDPRKAVVGAGFAEDSQRFSALVNSINAMQKEKQNDPVTYLQKYDPKFKALWENLGQSGNYAEYARTMTAEQQRLGVQDVKLLPEKYAQTVVSEFNKLAEGGENSADMIEQLAGQWGKQWPTVYKQLSKDLPPSALVIASGVDRPTAERLARLAPLKTQDLRKGLDETKTSKVKDELSTKFAEFQQTLLQQAGGERTFSTIYDQAERLALSYVAGGASPKDAVTKAYRSLVDDKYVIKDTYRVPRQYDADAISDTAEQLLRPENALENSFAIGKVGIVPERAQKPSNLVEEVYQDYPRLQQFDFQIKTSPRSDSRKMEFYFPGTDENPFGDKPGVEIFDEGMTKKDVFGEMLHYLPQVDPKVNGIRQDFLGSLSEQQKDEWLRGDYERQAKSGLLGENPTFDKWLQHQGGDAFFRGYLTGQYPAKAYTSEQKKMFEGLDEYLRGSASPSAQLDGIDVLPEPGVSKEFLQKRAQSAVRREGYWVTNRDESGLVLYMNGAAVTRNGQPIAVSFDELAGQ